MIELAAAYAGRRVCVTGGAGFIGSHLCDALVGAGADVCVIDDLSNGLTTNLDGVAGSVRFVRGSILDDEPLDAALAGADIVFHQAAVASVPRSVKEPGLSFETNATGTVRVLDAAHRAGVLRVVYASSSSAYGDQPGLPRVETMPSDIRSPYAAAKCAGELFVQAYARCSSFSAISLRYFNIFGARQRPDSPYAAVIPVFAEAMREGRAPIVYGDGTQTRDFTHVSNAVRANLLAGATARPLRGEIVNIAYGRSTSLTGLIEAMAAILGVEPRWESATPRVGEVSHSLACLDLARELIGYEPVTSFEEGLALTLRV